MKAAKRESRIVAKCFLDGTDIAGEIVKAGPCLGMVDGDAGRVAILRGRSVAESGQG